MRKVFKVRRRNAATAYRSQRSRKTRATAQGGKKLKK